MFGWISKITNKPARAAARRARALTPKGAARLRPYLVMAALLSTAFATESSELAPRAGHSLLLDVARAGNRVVAVGDRGHVLLSDDEGRNWRQVVVPARAMLNAVAFGDTRHGWAVGHDGVILATSDAGETWQRQDKGGELDAVWLDVIARDDQWAMACGAYGLLQNTNDGGARWIRTRPSADELHYNALSGGANGFLYLAGEQGTVLINGRKRMAWDKADLNYEGSLFGVLPLDEQHLLAYGLRGRIFASDDGGETWSERANPVPVLIMCGVQLKSGVIVLGGLSGNFFVSRDRGQTFGNWKPAEYNGGVASILETADGALLVAGELGLARLTLPEAPR